MTIVSAGQLDGSAKSSDSSISLSPGTTLDAGMLIVGFLGADPAVASPTIADPFGTTYSLISGAGNGSGTSGVEVWPFYGIANGNFGVGDAITFSYITNLTAKVLNLDWFSGDFSGGVSTDFSTATTGSSATPTGTSINLATGDLLVGMIGLEGPAGNNVVTQDSEFASGMTTSRGTTGGGAASNISVLRSHIVTPNANARTYNLTITTSRVWALCTVRFREIPAAGEGVPLRRRDRGIVVNL